MILKKINFIFTVFFIILMSTPYFFWNNIVIVYVITLLGWICTALLITYKVKKFKIYKVNLTVIFFILFILFYRAVGYSTAIFYNYASFIMFWFSLLIYNFYTEYFNEEYQIRICKVSIIVISINVFQNFIVLLKYPNASREITGLSLVHNFYRNINIGSTSFVFASMLLLLVFFGLFIYSKSNKYKFLFLLITIFFIFNQFQCARAISIILMLVAIIYSSFLIFLKKWTVSSKIIFLFIFMVLCILIISNIDSLLYFMSNNVNNMTLKNRLYDLAISIENRDFHNGASLDKRVELYITSLNTFLNHPFLGIGEYSYPIRNLEIGYHSEILDSLANYGFTAVFFWSYFYTWYYKNIIKKNKGKKFFDIMKVIYVIIIVYSFLNNIVAHDAISIMLFLVIPYIPLLYDKKNGEEYV